MKPPLAAVPAQEPIELPPITFRLYERQGYLRFGVLPGFYEDGTDAWRYEKRLPARPGN